MRKERKDWEVEGEQGMSKAEGIMQIAVEKTVRKQRKPEEKGICERLLRDAAENKLRGSSGTSWEMKERTPEGLLHQLQAHQIELEVQNEELRKAQIALEESKKRFADLYDFAPVGYFTFTSEALIKEVNLTGATLLEMDRQRLINSRFRRFVAPSDFDQWDQHFLRVLRQGEKQTCDLVLKRQDGSTFQAGLESIRIEVSREAPEVHTTVTDVTERKGMEEVIRQSEERYRTVIEEIDEGYYEVDLSGNFTFVNDSMIRQLQYSREELIGMNYRAYIPREEVEGVYKAFNRAYRTGEIIKWYPVTNIRKDGTSIFAEDSTSCRRNKEGRIIGFRGISRDITERKRAEEELRESEKKYRDLYDFLPTPVYEMDFEANITSVNRAVYETFGGTEEDFKKGSKAWRFLSPGEIERSGKNIQRLIRGEQLKGAEYTLMRLDGSVFPAIVISSVVYRNDTPVGLRGVIVDITERKQAEKSLQESDERYKALFDGSLDLVYITDFEGRFIDANAAALNRLGYTREELRSLNFASLLSEDQLSFALETVKEVRESGIQKGLMEFRLRHKNGSEVYVETQGSTVMSNGIPVGIQAVARDITERKRAEEQLQHTLESLRKAFSTIIQVMVSVVETRDPYTAGHQTRTADLARAMATEMGLSQDKIDGLRMAGSIHDIGKLSIPAEILSKPKKLSEIEFSLIKEHARKGYEILKKVESPWPLAEIIYQHHERMNGSGYPQGLKGKEICLEARILMVADVVEAMASYRPYRPALGIDKALEEISQNKGNLYDPEVVEACLRLFKEKRFSWE